MQRVGTVLKLIALTLAAYFLLRVVFWFIYFRTDDFSFFQYLQIFYWGLRLDFAALFYSNLAFFLFYFFIVPFIALSWQEKLSTAVFSLINLTLLALNFIDLVYYRYTLRRSAMDVFYILGDSLHSFGSLFLQYWFVLLIFILFSVLFVKATARILRRRPGRKPEKWYLRWLAPAVFMGLCFFIARGGDSRPIVPATALLHADPTVQPLVNNSTLNMLYSCLRATSGPERKSYFTPAALDSIYTIRRQYPPDGSFQKKNVMVFILESFNAGFFMPGPERASTPFFDSLMGKSTVCVNAFANGHESVKGVLAILGSIPPFLDEPLFISNYSAVPFKGIGSILKEEGYKTNFFLGAEYDHFNFAKLCRMTGIDHYYSEKEYDHPEHDDGSWGIYDEYFFRYFAAVHQNENQPFLSVLFNISSHPPYNVPPAQKNKFNSNDQLNSISYVDDCFRQLFDSIKKQPWFNNTLFVFCSDHTLLENQYGKENLYRAFHIPLFIYDPQKPSQQVITQTVQQLDIVPAILDRLDYPKPFMSFGNSFGRADSAGGGFSIYKRDESYQLTGDGMITGFDGRSGKTLYHYNYLADSLLTKDLSGSNDPAITQRANLIKAVLQRFNNSLLDQKLLINE
jgi:phosphoglycerol transferase MdoB-like AlkP superfamily enzyme